MINFIKDNKKYNLISAIQKSIVTTFIFLLTLSFTGCNGLINEDLDKCNPTYSLKFIYDMNMDYADAFAVKVNSVRVYAFDSATGELKKIISDSGNALAAPDYTLSLDLEPGDYEFIAWCGLEGNEDHFFVPTDVTGIEDVNCSISKKRDDNGVAIQNVDLHALYHGKINASLPLDNNNHVYEVPLIKDTNNINISIQEINGKILDPDRFEIKLTANNGLMAYNNNVIEDEDIEYYPYRKVSGSTVDGSRVDDENANDIVLAELSTSRLIADHNPKLDVIDKNNGKVIYSIPLVKWSLMLKSDQYNYMEDQEYLDREDEFNIILYIKGEEEIIPGEPEEFVAVSIFINSWRLVINGNTEL